MRTETKTIKIYNFDELSKETQEKLIEKGIENLYNDYLEWYLYDDMYEKANELLEKYFKNNKPELKNIYYSLSFSQGDGAMFEFNLYYYNKYIRIKQHGHYCHSRSFIIDTYELTEKQEQQLYNKILSMFKELEDYGWNLVEYTPEKEDVIEYLKENEYYKDGSIY